MEKDLSNQLDNKLSLDYINNTEDQEISEEEFLLECCRYNDIEGVKDVLDCGLVKLDYQNKESLNTALRKYLKIY